MRLIESSLERMMMRTSSESSSRRQRPSPDDGWLVLLLLQLAPGDDGSLGCFLVLPATSDSSSLARLFLLSTCSGCWQFGGSPGSAEGFAEVGGELDISKVFQLFFWLFRPFWPFSLSLWQIFFDRYQNDQNKSISMHLLLWGDTFRRDRKPQKKNNKTHMCKKAPPLPNFLAKFQPLQAKWCRNQFAERPKDGAFIGGVIYWSFINFI